MPTTPLKVQANGSIQWLIEIVGALSAYQAIDDSDGSTHDGDASYIRLARLLESAQQGRVTFPLFLQMEGRVPTSISLTVAAKRQAGPTGPDVQIGFYRGGSVAFHATPLVTNTSSYVVGTRTFATNPLTSAAWIEADAIGLEACLQGDPAVSGSNRISLLSGSLDWYPLTNHRAAISELSVSA